MNYLAILACGVAAMVVGFIWYGPLFGKAFMQTMGADKMSEEQKQKMKKMMGGMYVIQFVLSLITAWTLESLVMNTTNSAVNIAFWIWFGFIMTTEAGAALWSGKEPKMAWKGFLISASGALVTFIVFGFILGMWR